MNTCWNCTNFYSVIVESHSFVLPVWKTSSVCQDFSVLHVHIPFLQVMQRKQYTANVDVQANTFKGNNTDMTESHWTQQRKHSAPTVCRRLSHLCDSIPLNFPFTPSTLLQTSINKHFMCLSWSNMSSVYCSLNSEIYWTNCAENITVRADFFSKCFLKLTFQVLQQVTW